MGTVPRRVVRAARVARSTARRSVASLRESRYERVWATESHEDRLPDGFYVFVLHGIPANYGGLTASVLARAAAFAGVGQPVTIAMFGPVPRFRTLHSELAGRGAIPASGVTLRSLHEDLAASARRARRPGWASAPRPLGPHAERLVMTYEDGGTWQVDLCDEVSGQPLCHEFRRPDGTAYLRHHVVTGESGASTRSVEQIDPQGRLFATHRSIGALYRSWFDGVLGRVSRQPKFAVVDGPMASRHLLGLVRPDLFRVFAVHNTHIRPPGRWDGELKEDRAHMFDRMAELDALVLLSERQRADVEMRCGTVNNVFVIPHAAHPLSIMPDPEARARGRVVLVTRMARSKRVDHVLRAFKEVIAQVPDAHLDIYGAGPESDRLKKLAHELGLADAVTFCGFDQDASAQFRTATVTVLASMWEGQPLTILEAMGAGCPVVAYDIKYGPADAIEHGRTGLLVPEGDIRALGAAMVSVLENQQFAAQLGEAAWQGSHAFGEGEMMRRWRAAFHQLLRQRASRTRLDRVQLAAPVPTRAGSEVLLWARLRVSGRIPSLAARDLHVRWILLARDSAEQLSVPATWRRRPSWPARTGFEVTGRIPVERIDTLGSSSASGVDLYLDLTWNNSHWRARVGSDI